MEAREDRHAGDGRPLLTFLLLAYNQERFIRDAVEGAFAQTYSPLQIILSDDCSTDRTFGILSESAESYRGPHKLLLNRNPENLGLGEHVNRILRMAEGEIVLLAAGDDISLETRTERCYLEWVRTGGGACSIYSDAITIDPEGREIGRMFGGRSPSHARNAEEAVARGGTGVPGCAHSFTRRCFDFFGPFDRRVVPEDMAISYRSLLLGDIRYLDEPLVRYRIHPERISGDFRKNPRLSMRVREAENHESVFISWLQDTRIAAEKGAIPAEKAERIKRSLFLRQYWLNVEKAYHGSGWFRGLGGLFSSLLDAANPARPLKILERRRRSKA